MPAGKWLKKLGCVFVCHHFIISHSHMKNVNTVYRICIYPYILYIYENRSSLLCLCVCACMGVCACECLCVLWGIFCTFLYAELICKGIIFQHLTPALNCHLHTPPHTNIHTHAHSLFFNDSVKRQLFLSFFIDCSFYTFLFSSLVCNILLLFDGL